MMDRLDEKAIESMKDLAAGATRRLLPEPASVVFFDCTTLHFESVDADGLLIGYEVFPGSDCEGKSLIP